MAVTDLPVDPWNAIFAANFPVAPADRAGNTDLQGAIMSATELLWWLSGRRYGLYTRSLRPCRRPAISWPLSPSPLLNGFGTFPGSMWPLAMEYPEIVMCGNHTGDTCSCVMLEQAILPMTCQGVSNVKVDGTVLDPSTYVLYDRGRRLVRTDGGTFPWCQDLSKPDTEQGTWSMQVTLGLPVPVTGQRACGELATEFYMQATSGNCKLPTRIQSLSRQGVSVQFIDPQEFLKEGRVGMYLCDLFLGAVNPSRMRSASAVFSPDLHKGQFDSAGPQSIGS